MSAKLPNGIKIYLKVKPHNFTCKAFPQCPSNTFQDNTEPVFIKQVLWRNMRSLNAFGTMDCWHYALQYTDS